MEKQVEKYLSSFRNTLGEIKIHPYVEKLITAFLFGFTFYNLLSIPYYPEIYVILFTVIIVTASLMSKQLSLMIGILLSFPIFMYQEIYYSFYYMITSLFILAYSASDWKNGFYAFFIFILGTYNLYALTSVLLLLYGYMFGYKRGVVISLLTTLLLTGFAYGTNENLLGFFYLPFNSTPYLLPFKDISYSFTLSNPIKFNPIGETESNFYWSLYYFIEKYPSLLLQFLGVALGSYLASKVQEWKIPLREFLALPIGALPIIFSYGFSEYSITQELRFFNSLIIPLLVIVLLGSLVSPFLKIMLFQVNVIEIEEIQTPFLLQAKMASLEESNKTLHDDISKLRSSLDRYEKNYEGILLIHETLNQKTDNLNIISLDEVANDTNVQKDYVDRVLKYLSDKNVFIYNQLKIINKDWLKRILYEKMNGTYKDTTSQTIVTDTVAKENVVDTKKNRGREEVKKDPFREIWSGMINEFNDRKSVRVWNKMGYLHNEKFEAWYEDNTIICEDPSSKEVVAVPYQDFKITWENYRDYINDKVNRLQLYNLTKYGKYTLSIIHLFKDKK